MEEQNKIPMIWMPQHEAELLSEITKSIWKNMEQNENFQQQSQPGINRIDVEEYFKNELKEFDKNVDIGIEHVKWEEDSKSYSAWKIDNFYTGTAGMEMFMKALKEELTRYGTTE